MVKTSKSNKSKSSKLKRKEWRMGSCRQQVEGSWEPVGGHCGCGTFHCSLATVAPPTFLLIRTPTAFSCNKPRLEVKGVI